MSRILRTLLILGAGLLLLDAAIYVTMLNRAPVSAERTVVSSGTAAIGGPFQLVNTEGKQVSDQTFRGKWMLIYFGYTFCPDACPTALTNMGIAIETLGTGTTTPQPLFITVDPKRDTAAVLNSYLESFDPRIVGLTGSKAQTDAVVKAYRIYDEPQKPQADGSYLVDHSSYLYLMDPNGKFIDVIQGSTPPDQISAWLRKSMGDHAI